MKLFSRKAMVAGATALSLTFAGTTTAIAQEATETATATAGATETNTGSEDNAGDTNNEPETGSSDLSSEDSKVDPDDIKGWIGVVTAVIGALGAIFAFASKYLGVKF